VGAVYDAWKKLLKAAADRMPEADPKEVERRAEAFREWFAWSSDTALARRLVADECWRWLQGEGKEAS
jgi:hypothetical protein